MNILNLQVRIKKIKIKTNDSSSLCFSLRVGKVLSILSNQYPNKSGITMELNVDLVLAFQDNLLNNNSRACLIIYEVNNKQEKDIIGMVFILLKNQQNQPSKYKIQQCNDPASSIQLSFLITNLQVHQKQNQSLASKSSLAEIKQFHKVLTQGHKKSNSDYSSFNQQTKKQKIYLNQQYERQYKNQNFHKIEHIKSEQVEPILNEQLQRKDPKLLAKVQRELSRQKQKNSILTNILVIEQTKNSEAETMIKNTIKLLGCILFNKDSNANQINENHFNQLPNHKDHQDNNNKSLHFSFEEDTLNYFGHKLQQPNNKQKLDQLVNERDYLYTISEELYQRIKKYKEENQNLYENINNLENQLKFYIKQLEYLKQQNIELTTKIFQLDDLKREQSNAQQLQKMKKLKQENTQLKQQNIEFQRKFKQSYKALEQFKNDAWKAQEQLILKQQQLAIMKQDLENAKMSYENLKYQSNDNLSSISEIKDQRQSSTMLIQTFKFMAALIIKNNLERDNLLEKLRKSKTMVNNIREDNRNEIIESIKVQVDKMYRQYESSNNKTIHLLEIRRKFMNILNSLNF